jgi:uncharacterized membrane protein YgcG
VAAPNATTSQNNAQPQRPRDQTQPVRVQHDVTKPPALRPSSATPLPQATRRALEPLLGFDPAGVRVYQGVAAARIAAAKNADAVAIGEEIYMAADRSASAPENLGLLAHELTHVARARDPRYTPPVLNDTRPDAGGEETLARNVEARVTTATEPNRRSAAPRSASPAPESASAHPRSLYASPSASGGSQDQLGVLASPTAHNEWDGLPAPWEPLPGWMAPSLGAPILDVSALPPSSPATPLAVAAPASGFAPSTGMSAISGHRGVSAIGGDSGTSASGGGDGGGSGGGAQAAEKNRSLPPPATSSAPPPPPPAERAEPEPDLDALAKQVYAVLKRRLAAERRRSGT